MNASENRKSLMFGVPGIVLQIAGNVKMRSEPEDALGLVLALVGTVLLIVGLAFYAKAKGRSPAWGLMGLLSIIGLIVLALLKDHAVAQPRRR